MDEERQEAELHDRRIKALGGSDADPMLDLSDVEFVLQTDATTEAAMLERAFRIEDFKVVRTAALEEVVARLRRKGHRVLVMWNERRRSNLTGDVTLLRDHGVRTPILVVLKGVREVERDDLRQAGADAVVDAIQGNREIVLRAGSLALLVKRYTVRKYCGGSLAMDSETNLVICTDTGESKSAHLADHRFNFLSRVAKRPGEVVTHAVLDKYVFGRDMDTDRGKRTNVKSKTNRTLREISGLKTIESVRGRGFMLLDRREPGVRRHGAKRRKK